MSNKSHHMPGTCYLIFFMHVLTNIHLIDVSEKFGGNKLKNSHQSGERTQVGGEISLGINTSQYLRHIASIFITILDEPYKSCSIDKFYFKDCNCF
jgi:hypothetical protein